MEQLIL
jgi:hypothetical protein